jgi:hypothetical protein
MLGGTPLDDSSGASSTPFSWNRNGQTAIGLEQTTTVMGLAIGDGINVAICAYQDSGAARNVVLAYLEGWFIKS